MTTRPTWDRLRRQARRLRERSHALQMQAEGLEAEAQRLENATKFPGWPVFVTDYQPVCGCGGAMPPYSEPIRFGSRGLRGWRCEVCEAFLIPMSETDHLELPDGTRFVRPSECR